MNDSVLVTGGCGVLGSAIVDKLRQWGIHVVVIDDLSRSSVHPNGDTYVGDFSDLALLTEVFRNHSIGTVIHCAAYVDPAESVREPQMYRVNNTIKTRRLISFLHAAQVQQFIFSSSAAVYGNSPEWSLNEFQHLQPASPYARSKVETEHELKASTMRGIAFRYFNPITRWPKENTVVGAMLRASRDGWTFRINGDNWGTSDGTPVRDFIDVDDLAIAHVQAVHCIGSLPRGVIPINLGSGVATPILRLAKTVSTVTRPHGLAVTVGPRRAGDIRGGAADIDMARRVLNWAPQVPLEESVARAWENIE